MPTYEYTCTKCTHSWDEFHSVADRDLPLEGKCAKCKKKSIARAFTTPPVTGVDATVGPGADFRELTKKIGAGLPKRYRENLDRAASLRGRKYGAQ
jgi:putative FmdB family regulatory protein